MDLSLQDTEALEGTGKVGLRPTPADVPVLSGCRYVRLRHAARAVGAVVESVSEGRGSLLADKYLRLHLQARPNQPVAVEPFTPETADRVHLIVPPAWASGEGGRLLSSLLGVRPVCRGQKLPVYTFSGAVITVDVASTEPDGIVLLASQTELVVGSAGEGAAGAAGVSPGVTWDVIGGLRQEIRRVRELVEFPLRSPEAFASLGIAAPRGLILHGPPGTGKTLIAKALSNEVGAEFIAIQGPEILSAYLGESERQLRERFEKARASAPAVILIDELDSLAPKRDDTRGEAERRLVATLLSLMDGLSELRGVVVIGTTNRLNAIDPALRRPGRFEHEIHVGVPDRDGRLEIISIHTRRMPLADDVDLADLADRTPGFVGADIASLCREAGYNALRRLFPAQSLEAGALLVDQSVRIAAADFLAALGAIRPSAMREVTVQVSREVTWDQIGGLEEVKRLITESVVYGIRRSDAYRAVGVRPARGLLLYGPPGTGKTLLAKAVANECGANFILVRGPEVYSKWFGESEEKLRFVFAKAREVAPAVIFFDEIDAIAPERGKHAQGATDSMVNQLLAEMDGAATLDQVFVMAATNAVDLLDPALLRPGRFDLQIYVPLPDEAARERIFRVHTRAMPLDEGVSIGQLARLSSGASGADIAEVCRQAGLYALRETGFEAAGLRVRMQHFLQALEDLARTQKHLKPRRLGFQVGPEE